MAKTVSTPGRLLRLPDVKKRVGWSRSSIYAAIARGDFPKQVSLGPRSVGFLEREVEEWIAARVAARDKAAP